MAPYKALEGQDALYDFFGLGKVLTEFETYRLAMKKWAWQKRSKEILSCMEARNLTMKIIWGFKSRFHQNL